jgi:hypothetical protein
MHPQKLRPLSQRISVRIRSGGEVMNLVLSLLLGLEKKIVDGFKQVLGTVAVAGT